VRIASSAPQQRDQALVVERLAEVHEAPPLHVPTAVWVGPGHEPGTVRTGENPSPSRRSSSPARPTASAVPWRPELADAGATLLLHGPRPGTPRRGCRRHPRPDGDPAPRTYRADLASLEEVRRMAAEVAEHEPRLEALVNNGRHRDDVAGRRRAHGQRRRPRAAVRRQLPVRVPPHPPAHGPRRRLGAGAHRQRQLGGAGRDRLRRRDAGARLPARRGLTPRASSPRSCSRSTWPRSCATAT